MTTVSFAEIGPQERYKLLCATIVPRPIALVTTVDEAGVVNAAPFSFFNVFAEDPPLVVLGLQHKPDRNRKDTTRNIAETGVFVVNLVDEALAEAMNVCSVDFPPAMSEVDAAGLSLSPGRDVPVPHIAEAPFSLECRRTASLAFGPDREIVIGEVVRLHAREGLLDEARPSGLDRALQACRPAVREFLSRQSDHFDLVKQSYAEWEEAAA
ncbi:flavin reductase family protein [Micromonospora sp. STR1s_5]|nr:flavin reductase family protein [Micromonospora sp. STR1s_5]